MNIEIANRLVQLRKENGLSQEALAAKLGISRQAISKWERAEASPDTDNLMALAELYGMSLDALLNTANDQYVLDTGETETAEDQKKVKKAKTELQKKAIKMFKFPFPLFVVLIFLAFGFAANLWHPAWLVFLLIPIYYHLAGALCVPNKKARLLAMPVPEVALLIYLCFGILANLWSPTWIVFLAIPLYYWLVASFYKGDKKEKDAPEEEK